MARRFHPGSVPQERAGVFIWGHQLRSLVAQGAQMRIYYVLGPIKPSAKFHWLGQTTGLKVNIDCRTGAPAQLCPQFFQRQILMHVSLHPLLSWMVRTCPKPYRRSSALTDRFRVLSVQIPNNLSPNRNPVLMWLCRDSSVCESVQICSIP